MTLNLKYFKFISTTVSTFIVLCTIFIFSNNVSAVSDISVTIDSQSSFSRGDSVFPTCDSTCIHQYNYFIVDFNVSQSQQANYGDFRFTIDRTGFNSSNFYVPPFDTYLVIDDIISDIKYYSILVPSGTITLTLSETLPYDCPDCPDCPEPEPCDCDTPPIVAFFRDVFLNVVTGVIPAFAVFVVVWFMVDLLSSLWFGRGK